VKGPRILAMVMAGGEGTRLHPLTAERSKPAVPFGGRHRIVDFVLSNLINSGIHSIYLLVQYKSQSLIDHINHAWELAALLSDLFVTVVPPQMHEGPEWYQGTADSVFQNLRLIERHNPDLVAVFGADHIYRMDVGQMVKFHLQRQADVTLSAIPMPLQDACSFGVIVTDYKGLVTEFQEKPAQPSPMIDDPSRAFCSMGNYLFKTEVLIKALLEGRERGENDFGRHVLPRLLHTHRIFAYNFEDNQVPGVRAYEDQSYWRDVGTLDAYFGASQDVLGQEPRFNLFNPSWPIRSSTYQGPTARFLEGSIFNSIVGPGTLIKGATLRNSIIRREVLLEEDVEVCDSVIMDYNIIRRGARLNRVIIDRDNIIECDDRIGFDHDRDRQRFHVTDSGIVVVPRGRFDATNARCF
jgi:glucose-1-phosphate adenylyltransferase